MTALTDALFHYAPLIYYVTYHFTPHTDILKQDFYSKTKRQEITKQNPPTFPTTPLSTLSPPSKPRPPLFSSRVCARVLRGAPLCRATSSSPTLPPPPPSPSPFLSPCSSPSPQPAMAPLRPRSSPLAPPPLSSLSLAASEPAMPRRSPRRLLSAQLRENKD